MIEARAVIMKVSRARARARVAECHLLVPRLESWQGGTVPQSTVPQLAPRDPGHLTHPTDICQQRSAATVRPQFVRLIT